MLEAKFQDNPLHISEILVQHKKSLSKCSFIFLKNMNKPCSTNNSLNYELKWSYIDNTKFAKFWNVFQFAQINFTQYQFTFCCAKTNPLILLTCHLPFAHFSQISSHNFSSLKVWNILGLV